VRERLSALSERAPVRLLSPLGVPEHRRVLFAVLAELPRPETWTEPLRAYAEAFGPDDETTLLFAAAGEGDAFELVAEELRRSGVDDGALADIALVDASGVPAELIELAADAVISTTPRASTRARRTLPPDASALRLAAA
jgi:hypothetical protein